ncbi:MAG: hypothetical protein IJC46_08120 [Clostridia bacterium]|nr:hypothetical protein [Clostridia bacterium]
MNQTKKPGMIALIMGLIFLAYNVIVFIAAGFAEHTAVFWLSYGFMLVAFITFAGASVAMSQSDRFLKDWIFGRPILTDAGIYVGVELLLSVIFMIVDGAASWQLAFILQFLLFVAALVLILSCFYAKSVVEDIQERVDQKTGYIRMLQADASVVAQRCADPEARARYAKLAEDIRFSDPMSSPALQEIERAIAETIAQGKNAVLAGDYRGAIVLCDHASAMLYERNEKCKILK